MNNNHPTKSEIFTAYNIARAHARQHGDPKQIERLNKALGVLLSANYYTGERADYQPTTCSCNCADMTYRYAARRAYTGVCKHAESEMLLITIQNRRADHLFVVPSVSVSSDVPVYSLS